LEQPLEREKKKSEPHQGLLYILFAFFGFLAGRSFSKFGTPQDRSANDTAPQPEPTLNEQVAPTPRQAEYTERSKRHTPLWEKVAAITIAGGTVGLLVVNIFLFCATKKAADAAKESADLTRKQMESTGAAVIEITKGVAVYFPVPPSGEVRMNLRNSGHVIAHDIHISLSLSLKDTGEQSVLLRTVFSKMETIPAIAPSMYEDRPDRIYSFELSRDEHDQIMATKAYLVVEGGFDYENGFDTRTKQPFCNAIIYGPKFGSWQGACDQAQTQIRMAHRLAK
jgi:hypothetical protein